MMMSWCKLTYEHTKNNTIYGNIVNICLSLTFSPFKEDTLFKDYKAYFEHLLAGMHGVRDLSVTDYQCTDDTLRAMHI